MRTLFLKWRERILVWLTHEVALPVLVLVRKNKPFPYTHAELTALPAGSLGHEMAAFLDGHGLHLLPHYEKHDIKHVLLGYPPTDHGEICLQSFMFGNGHYSFPVLVSVAFGLLVMPDCHAAMRKAWRRGRSTPSLDRVDWFSLVPYSLAGLRRELHIPQY